MSVGKISPDLLAKISLGEMLETLLDAEEALHGSYDVSCYPREPTSPQQLALNRIRAILRTLEIPAK